MTGRPPPDWGLTAQTLDSSLYSAFGQSEVSIIYTQLNQYYVVLEVAPQYWQTPQGLKDIYLRSTGSTGASVTTASGISNTSSGGMRRGPAMCRSRQSRARKPAPRRWP